MLVTAAFWYFIFSELFNGLHFSIASRFSFLPAFNWYRCNFNFLLPGRLSWVWECPDRVYWEEGRTICPGLFLTHHRIGWKWALDKLSSLALNDIDRYIDNVILYILAALGVLRVVVLQFLRALYRVQRARSLPGSSNSTPSGTKILKSLNTSFYHRFNVPTPTQLASHRRI